MSNEQTSESPKNSAGAAVEAHLRIIPREQHTLSRKNISNGALRVLYRLNEAGFAACLVGGAVRDLLLGGHPKDFDRLNLESRTGLAPALRIIQRDQHVISRKNISKSGTRVRTS